VARVFPSWAPSEQRALVRRVYLNLGEALGETIAILHGRDSPGPMPLSPDARRVLRSALGAGRGVLFASAHLGPWERVAWSLLAAGIPLTAVVRESYDPRFAVIYRRLRARTGLPVIDRGAPGAAFAIVRTLRAGRVLGIQMDLKARVPCRMVPFLGIAAPTAIGPALIALRTGAPVVVGTAALDDEGAPVVTATLVATDDLRADPGCVLELTRRINAELSARVLRLPEAWVWPHDRWTNTERL
jgi:KDO2-lipid IV(A) lauroyltransferase